MKKILAVAVLALSRGFLNSNVDESVFVSQLVMTQQNPVLDESTAEFEDSVESDSENERDLKSNTVRKSFRNHLSNFHFYLSFQSNSIKNLEAIIPFGVILPNQFRVQPRLMGSIGSSRAPPAFSFV